MSDNDSNFSITQNNSPKENDSLTAVSFSLFGENFTLSCRKDQKEALQKAIDAVIASTSRLLRDNPNLSPQQACILTAINTQSALQEFLGSDTPFQHQARKIISKTRECLLRAQNNGISSH